MKEKKIIIISGPSGVGKTTLYKNLLRVFSQEMSFSVSVTTRKSRKNEAEGKDYFFVNKERFSSLIENGQLVEWAKVHGNFYGTLKSEVHRIWQSGMHCLLDVDVQGGINVQKQFGERAFLIFIAPPSIEVLQERLYLRSEDENRDVLRERLVNAEKEMDYQEFYNVTLKNIDLNQTKSELITIVQNVFDLDLPKIID